MPVCKMCVTSKGFLCLIQRKTLHLCRFYIKIRREMGKESGYKNLIPFAQRSEEEQRKIRAKGGKASVKVRQEKRTMKQLLDIVFSHQQVDTETGEMVTKKMASMKSLAEKCEKGDVKAIELAAKLCGELKTNVEVTGKEGKDLIDTRGMDDKVVELHRLMSMIDDADQREKD